MNLKKIPFGSLCFATALAAAGNARADLITEATRVYNVDAEIDDLQDPPDIFAEMISDSLIYFLTDVEVSLRLVGVEEDLGFASEMFVSLNRNLTQTSILLNQVGLSEENPVGFAYDGWDVTFSDSASGDVHLSDPGSGILGGRWQPDGRADATSSERPQMLSAFDGTSGNATWILAVGDLQLGGQMRLESWSITLTGYTEPPISGVPEANPLWPVSAIAALIFARRLRHA